MISEPSKVICSVKVHDTVRKNVRKTTGMLSIVVYLIAMKRHKYRPRHKKTCTPEHSHLVKLAEIYLANPLLHGLLAVSLILLFDLAENPVIDKLLVARLKLNLIPADPHTYAQKIKEGADNLTPVQCMLNLETLEALDGPFSDAHLEGWRTARESASGKGLKGVNVSPAIMVELVVEGGRTVTIPIIITSEHLEMARKKEPLKVVSKVSGSSELPMTVSSCIE
jgi:hypothetical protein